MLRLIMTILVPICVFIYTCSFGRWMQKKNQMRSAISAYILACSALAISSVVMWKMFF